MRRRAGLFLAVTVALLAAVPAARASISVVGSPWRGGSVAVRFAAQPLAGELGFDTIEVLSGSGHGDPPAVFEPPVFRDLFPWTDSGGTSTTSGTATGPLVTPGKALLFDIYFNSDLYQPFAFDLYAVDVAANKLDFSAHVSYDGYNVSIAEPADLPYVASLGPVPEPGAFATWSLLGGLVIAASWRKRKRA